MTSVVLRVNRLRMLFGLDVIVALYTMDLKALPWLPHTRSQSAITIVLCDSSGAAKDVESAAPMSANRSVYLLLVMPTPVSTCTEL